MVELSSSIRKPLVLASVFLIAATSTPLPAQERVLGTDISYWNCGTSSTGISQNNWNTAFSTGNRKFVFLRATRGGTTGLDQTSGTPGGGSQQTLSQRYDDPRFVQNLIRATAAGMMLGPYHFGRPDVSGNTGVDEADHFIQMAGAWMRPGYLMPMFDQEAGSALGGNALVQFALDFSDRIYGVMQIRPCIYINGNYSSIFQSATQARRDLLAKPVTFTPSVTGPAYPMLWDARYSDNTNPDAIPVQTGDPKNTYTTISSYYGPWDDYGDTEPWSFWQYASTVSIPGINAVDSGVDADVSHGDIEYVRNYLVPAVWWNDSNGDWATLANWNSGQTPTAPISSPGQATPYATGGLPTPRAPGAAGTGPTSGQYDTVILERPNANITVTVSSGSYNIRKLYMREALSLTGGSLTINYDPTYRPDNSSYVLHGGPISAQFSGQVTLSGSATLTVHTVQVDTNRVFLLSGGTLAFNTINLMPHTSTPGRIVVNGNAAINPLNNATARILNGSGSGTAGYFDLGNGARTITVGDGSAETDLAVSVQMRNGGLVKAGPGTLALTGANNYAGGTTVNEGVLLVNTTAGSGTGSGSVTVNGGKLGGTGYVSGLVTLNSGGTILPGSASAMGVLTLGTAPSLAGTNFMRINRNGGAPLADRLALTTGTLTYGGTLVVANTGVPLTGGEQFLLFSAPAYAGAFTASNLPALNPGLNWDLTSLTFNGRLIVNRQPVATNTQFTNTPGVLWAIPVSALLSNATDADGHPLSLAAFDSATTNGISLSSDGTNIYYRNDSNLHDGFGYTLTDNHGGTASAWADILPGVEIKPSIVSGPTNVTVTAGQDAVFAVFAEGTLPLKYQWRFNGSPIGTATDSSYIRPAVQTSDEGEYSVIVSNIAGSFTSSPALLTVLLPTPARIDYTTLLSDGRFLLGVRADPGHYAIEASSNLVNWQELTNLLSTNTTFEFIDPDTNNSHRVYRTRTMP